MFTRNEIERTFLLHRPEVIRTISLPIQRLAALPSIVTSLLNLVRFELYGITWHFNLDPAIEFVQQHTKLHGTIRELKVAGPNDVEARQLKKPKLHGIIQAIKHPRVIDLSRYKEAVRDLNSFQIQNVDRLEQLLFNIEYIPPSRPPPTPKLESSATVLAAPSPQVQNGAPLGQEDHTLDLIRECSSLTTLHIGVQSPTAFSWAVNCYDSNPSSMLLRPKVLHISSAGASTAKRIVEDCVYAFRNSLEDLKGVALSLSRASSSPSIKIASFGWSWPLHQLSVLSLQGELATWFDLESLRFCPKLTEFKLRLQPNPPAKADFLEKVFLAPHLKVFSLTGLWIVTDSVMDSLGDGLAKLQSLVIIGCDCQSVTGDGLKRALSKMKTLERAQLDLGEKMEVVLERYRGERPGLEIRGATHDILGRRD
ncbi:hypothetical protein BGZ65_003676 [Modicella reniformis]|uniref:Uncharacterized protein n=1 Tax=Modicella reniformis TaxID=1440133 RepID=A0A9P6J697_9FUNG|nr:hypothetical protein BGZ65_003676 [Modicella reniformis]